MINLGFSDDKQVFSTGWESTQAEVCSTADHGVNIAAKKIKGEGRKKIRLAKFCLFVSFLKQ